MVVQSSTLFESDGDAILHIESKTAYSLNLQGNQTESPLLITILPAVSNVCWTKSVGNLDKYPTPDRLLFLL